MPLKAKFGTASFKYAAVFLPALTFPLTGCNAVKDMKTSFSGDSVHPQSQDLSRSSDQRAFYAERRRPLNNPPVDGDPRYSGMYGENMLAASAAQAGSPAAGYPQGLPASPAGVGAAMATSYPGADMTGTGMSDAGMPGMSGSDAFASGGGYGAGTNVAAAPYAGGGEYATPYGAGAYNNSSAYGAAAPVGYSAGQGVASSYAGGSEMPLDLNGGFPGDANAGQYGQPYRAPAAADPYAQPQQYGAAQQQPPAYGSQPGGAAAYGTDAYAANAYSSPNSSPAYGYEQQQAYAQQPSYGAAQQYPQGYGAAPSYDAPQQQQPSVEGYGEQGSYGDPQAYGDDAYYGGSGMSSVQPIPDSRTRYASRNRTAYYNSFADANSGANPVANSDISY